MEIKIYKIQLCRTVNNAQENMICWVLVYKMQMWNECNSINAVTSQTSVLVPLLQPIKPVMVINVFFFSYLLCLWLVSNSTE